MRKQQFLTLTSVNLRYANPQLTDKARKKGKAGSTLTSYLLFQYAFSGVVFLLVYGLTMITLDFSQMPGFFTYYVALFGILGFSMSFSRVKICQRICRCLFDRVKFFWQRSWWCFSPLRRLFFLCWSYFS